MKHVLLATMLLILFLFGCTSLSGGQNLELQVTPSLTVTPAGVASATSTLVATETPAAMATSTNTSTPRPSLTNTATKLSTGTPTPSTPATAAVEQRCSASEPVQVEQTDLAQGLVFDGRTEIRVLGNAGLQNPVWLYPYLDDNTSSTISPNGNWIAFMTYHEVDREKDVYSIAMRVTNWDAGQEFQAQFDNLTLSRFALIRWINDSQIIFPLANEDELFRWLVWSPFSSEEETLSIELPNVSQRQRFLDYAYPSPDPLLELVVYPCEDCGDAEYGVKQLQTGEPAWSIDVGPNPSYDYRSPAYWSPNGEFVTVVGGQFLNQLLFFNREGEKLYQINFPLLNDPGGLAITAWAWSPNSKYLAFLRVKGSAGQYKETLSYMDMQDGRVVDLCINARTGSPVWSPDSTKIAFSQQIQSGEEPRLISIVDVNSGEVIQLHDAEARTLVDWITTSEPEP